MTNHEEQATPGLTNAQELLNEIEFALAYYIGMASKAYPDMSIINPRQYKDKLDKLREHLAPAGADLGKVRDALQVVGLSYELAVQSGQIPDDDGSITEAVNEALSILDRIAPQPQSNESEEE